MNHVAGTNQIEAARCLSQAGIDAPLSIKHGPLLAFREICALEQIHRGMPRWDDAVLRLPSQLALGR